MSTKKSISSLCFRTKSGANEWQPFADGFEVLSQGIHDLFGDGYLVHVLDPNYEDGYIPILSARDGSVYWTHLAVAKS